MGTAVPFFFVMSAYWLFRFDIHGNNAMNTIMRKLKKKIKTICLPYLLWNTFGMVFYMSITHIPFAANMMNDGETIPITLSNVLQGVFLHKYYFTFWYLQDLIILTLISPILLIILKNKYVSLVVIVASIVSVLLNVDLVIVKGTSLLFFMIGGYAVTYATDFFENKSDKAWVYFVILILAGVVQYTNLPVIERLAYIISPILLWKSADVVVPLAFYKKEMGWFTTQSFFIYASHVIPVTIIGHLMAKVSQTYSWAMVSYLIAPWITLILIYIVANMLHKHTPKFYGLICGGRT